MAGSRMDLVMDKHQRWILGSLYPAAMVALAVVPWLITAGDLPDPLATHFDGSRRANGSLPIVGEIAILVIFSGIPAIALAAMARRPGRDAALVAPLATFVGLLNGFLWLFAALANEGHSDWHDVRLGSGAVAGSIVGALGASTPVMQLARRHAAALDTGGRRPQLSLGPGERAAWFGGTRSYPFLVGGSVLAIAGLAVVVRSAVDVGVVLLLVGVVFLLFASVDVAVTSDGVRIRSGPVGWPAMRLGLDRIDAAAAISAKPLALGGWGYRGSLRFGRAAWILRGGEALDLRLAGGKRFTVTVDNAAEAAAVVNGLIARGGGSARPTG